MEERKVSVSGVGIVGFIIYIAIMHGSCQIAASIDHIADAVRAHQCR